MVTGWDGLGKLTDENEVGLGEKLSPCSSLAGSNLYKVYL